LVSKTKEVPFVQFNITIDGGQCDKPSEVIAVAQILTKGTKPKLQQEEAIEQLGASINVFAGTETKITISSQYPFHETIMLLSDCMGKFCYHHVGGWQKEFPSPSNLR
jgi:hypothetical protein